MKIKLFVSVLMLGSISFMNMSCDLFEDLFEDSGSKCIIGTWDRSICSGNTATISFSSGGTGYFQDKDCTNQCTRRYNFNWTESGGSVTLTYTSATICGSSITPPSGGSQSYTCSGNTLTIGNTYSKR
jgi:hypothetical protein